MLNIEDATKETAEEEIQEEKQPEETPSPREKTEPKPDVERIANDVDNRDHSEPVDIPKPKPKKPKKESENSSRIPWIIGGLVLIAAGAKNLI